MEPPILLLLDPDAVRLRASSIPGCIEIKPSSSLSIRTTHDQSNHVTNATATTSNDDNDSNNHDTNKYICSCLVGCYNNEIGTSVELLTNPFGLFEQQQRNPQNLARVTVYCKTGTIAIGRILYNTNANTGNTNTNTVQQQLQQQQQQQSKIRHIFRKNVSSLDIVERCLRQPTEIQSIDWNLIGMTDTTTTSTNTSNDTTTNSTNPENTHHHSLSISNNLELINVGLAILNSERDKLIQHVHTIEKSTMKPKQTTTTSTIPNTSSQSSSLLSTRTGTEFQFSLAINPMKHVDQCLNDIQQMNKYVTWVTTDGVGTVFLYGNGGVAYTPNIPQLLYQRLYQLRTTSKVRNHRPKYVVLGTKERFFVIFYDNTYFYHISHHKKQKQMFEQEIKKLNIDQKSPPLSIAFGKNDDTIFIIYHNGTYQYYGKSIPYDLIQCLHTIQKQQNTTTTTVKLSSVALGPNNEWFIRIQPSTFRSNDDDNGTTTNNKQNQEKEQSQPPHQLLYYGNISYEMEMAIRDIIIDGHVIQYLDFGENYSYFISYD
jgi:hypothetical protein